MKTTTTYYQLFGVIYLIAFLSLYSQFPGLVGHNGILPSDQYIRRLRNNFINAGIKSELDIFLASGNISMVSESIGLSVDCMNDLLLWVGMFASSIISAGVFQPVHSFLFFLAWISYVSIIHSGQTFLSFQWDILLCECGFLCFISSLPIVNQNSSLWAFRFLAWKLMFCSGVVKLQSQCPTWENLTALEYHFASQCIPTPLAWYAHQIPSIFLRLAVAITLVIEIPLAFMLIAPLLSVRRFGVVLQIGLQIIIILTGNYNFFNILTCILMYASWIDDFSYLSDKMNRSKKSTMIELTINILICLASFVWMVKWNSVEGPWWIGDRLGLRIHWIQLNGILLILCLFTVMWCLLSLLGTNVLSIWESIRGGRKSTRYVFAILRLAGICPLIAWILLSASDLQSIANISPHIPSVVMSFKQYTRPFLVSSSYGLFRLMTGVGKSEILPGYGHIKLPKTSRPEIVLEGFDGHTYRTIEFLYKPSSLDRSPPFIVPHQPRLDWQMWFASLGHYNQNPWLVSLIHKLLNPSFPQNANGKTSHVIPIEILSLLNTSAYPFHNTSLVSIRSTLFDYDFTSAEMREKNIWWSRSNPREYLPVLERNNPSVEEFLHAYGISQVQYMSREDLYSYCTTLTSPFYNNFHNAMCAVVLIPRDYSNSWASVYFQVAVSIVIIGRLSILIDSRYNYISS